MVKKTGFENQFFQKLVSGVEVRLLTRFQNRVKKKKWDFGEKPGLEKKKKNGIWNFGRKSIFFGTSHEPLRVTRNGLMNKVTPSQPERDSISQTPKQKEACSMAK